MASLLFVASGVREEILPSVGPLMITVHRQNYFIKLYISLLYAPPTATPLPRGPRRAAVAFQLRIPATCLSSAALSSSVKNSLLAYRAGRCKGIWYSLFQMPCRSGSPHGVLGAGPAFAPVSVFWPATGPGASSRSAITTASAPSDATNVRIMRNLLGQASPGEKLTTHWHRSFLFR